MVVHRLSTTHSHHALMGLFFFPRGGSAHLARNLAGALPKAGWDVTVLSGSRAPGGDARRFYQGLDVRPVEVEDLSYENHLPNLDDEQAEATVLTWTRALQSANAADADVLHLHHLTPLNEAAARVAPNVPIVGHLHGTEMLALEAIDRDPDRFAHGGRWAERMRGWAANTDRMIVASPSQVARAERLLGISPDVIANGYDPECFHPRPVDRSALWRRILGADAPGEEPVLIYVGRFTAVKRLPLLIEAYAAARERFLRRAPLVLVGGFPGECEGEHPRDTIERLGVEDVHLAGWHEHAELPEILAAGAAIVLPSVGEQFGQVLVEGMACGLPAIAADDSGPAEIVKHGETGWLVRPDDADSLADALADAVNHPQERLRRGANARNDVAARFTWPALAERVADVLDATMLRRGAAATL
jgi:glycosyltransferase involved in cell wall biosynthesis